MSDEWKQNEDGTWRYRSEKIVGIAFQDENLKWRFQALSKVLPESYQAGDSPDKMGDYGKQIAVVKGINSLNEMRSIIGMIEEAYIPCQKLAFYYESDGSIVRVDSVPSEGETIHA